MNNTEDDNDTNIGDGKSNDDNNIYNKNKNINNDNSIIAVSVLNHIRYCEIVYSPRYLLSLLVDILCVLPHTMQIEIISALPGKYEELLSLRIDFMSFRMFDLIFL